LNIKCIKSRKINENPVMAPPVQLWAHPEVKRKHLGLAEEYPKL